MNFVTLLSLFWLLLLPSFRKLVFEEQTRSSGASRAEVRVQALGTGSVTGSATSDELWKQTGGPSHWASSCVSVRVRVCVRLR